MASQFGPEPIEYSTGGPIANQPIYVRLRGSLALAELYSDAMETTEADNPVLTDGAGMLTFFARAGYYDLVFHDFEFPITVGIPTNASARFYTHVQTVPAMQWVINHGLDFTPAGVILIGPDGNPMVGAVYYDGPLVLVDYAAPQVGSAHLS